MSLFILLRYFDATELLSVESRTLENRDVGPSLVLLLSVLSLISLILEYLDAVGPSLLLFSVLGLFSLILEYLDVGWESLLSLFKDEYRFVTDEFSFDESLFKLPYLGTLLLLVSLLNASLQLLEDPPESNLEFEPFPESPNLDPVPDDVSNLEEPAPVPESVLAVLKGLPYLVTDDPESLLARLDLHPPELGAEVAEEELFELPYFDPFVYPVSVDDE